MIEHGKARDLEFVVQANVLQMQVWDRNGDRVEPAIYGEQVVAHGLVVARVHRPSDKELGGGPLKRYRENKTSWFPLKV